MSKYVINPVKRPLYPIRHVITPVNGDYNTGVRY